MRLEDALEVLVEKLLPRFSSDNSLLLISLDVRACVLKPKNGKQKRVVRRYVYLMFHRPNNYTKVLWNATTNNRKPVWDFTEWEVKSDHDSCWTTDGLSTPLFNLGLVMTKEIDPKLPPIDCEVLAHFSWFMRPRLVTIKGYQYDREKHKFTVQWK
ncbi:MAG: hypothetical protein HYW90_00710 [Candidatus Sungbacteria bacterium]|nr:hypothetical protein [Candidatus Sungbacteria bacterium]